MPSISASTASGLCYVTLLAVTVCAVGVSCVALLSQAVRTAPNQNWPNNGNVVIIGASYIVFTVLTLGWCVRRRLAVTHKLQRIPKSRMALRTGDVPKAVHDFIAQEYLRACVVTYESQPKGAVQEGWGRPDTKYEGVHFRRTLLDTLPAIDALAHLVIPRHPDLRPYDRPAHHFRFIAPLLPPTFTLPFPNPPPTPSSPITPSASHFRDTSSEPGLSALHYYDAALQLARFAKREPSEAEFELGMLAADEIRRVLNECRLEMMLDGSTTDQGKI